jgi:hypothetical protein
MSSFATPSTCALEAEASDLITVGILPLPPLTTTGKPFHIVVPVKLHALSNNSYLYELAMIRYYQNSKLKLFR